MHVQADNFGVGIPLTLMCDSGATISVVPKKLLQRFPHKSQKFQGKYFGLQTAKLSETTKEQLFQSLWQGNLTQKSK